LETRVLIIGGGVTGTGLARDLALRGVPSILAEQNDINAGASGANHGLLHSGARYVSSDPESARACKAEGNILKQTAADCIEDTGGLFVAVEGDDERYVADFPHMCARCGIPVRNLGVDAAGDMEPFLSKKLIAAYEVEDASIDPFKLSMENISQAREMGCTLLRHSGVVGFTRDGNRIRSVNLLNLLTGETFSVEAGQVVNAAGAWAGNIAAMVGVRIPMVYSKGSLVVTHNRITDRVVNRLRPASNGDILVPGGTVSILGTTSIRLQNLVDIHPTVEEVDRMVGEGAAMIPVLETTRLIRAYAGVRPLIDVTSNLSEGSAKGDGRTMSRDMALFDHTEDGLENFLTITGGKLTTYRLMAEKAADLVCERMGIDRPCLTRTQPLPSALGAKWTKPGLAPKLWLKHREPDDVLICECEMVPRSAVDTIIESIHHQNGRPDLMSIGLRSRIGKGACQGTVCGFKLAAYLYGIEELHSEQGLNSLKAFLRERWRGVKPLLWDTPLVQAELQEALYCGLCGLAQQTHG
jgi:glycerol-3-phosphate dehydrogenase